MAALMAAFLWAVASVMFSQLGKYLTPLALNLTKGTMALVLIEITLALLGRSPATLSLFPTLLLLTSGMIGIGVGDTAFFAALNHLGARRALLLETLAPPMAALMALVFLQEQLNLLAWTGIGLTLVGVAWVISERTPDRNDNPPPRLSRGLILGLLAALGQATGAVLSRSALADTLVDPLWSTALRLIGGLAVMGVLLRSQGQVATQFQPLRSPQVLTVVALAAVFGTYLGIWLQQIALKSAPTGIAQALTSTSPLFILPLAALMGERISLRAILGVVVALAGVGILVGQG